MDEDLIPPSMQIQILWCLFLDHKHIVQRWIAPLLPTHSDWLKTVNDMLVRETIVVKHLW